MKVVTEVNEARARFKEIHELASGSGKEFKTRMGKIASLANDGGYRLAITLNAINEIKEKLNGTVDKSE